MARTDTLTNFLTDVAAAIKAKKGDETAIPAENFDTEIASLPSGGADTEVLKSIIEKTATELVIPDGCTKIGQYALSYCSNLESLTIPNSCKRLEDYSCYGCEQLSNITLGEGIESLGRCCFQYALIEGIALPSALTNIDRYAFRYCTSLKSLSFPEGYKIVNTSICMGCTSLKTVVFPSTVNYLHGQCFSGCTSLEVIDFSLCTSIPTMYNATPFENCPSTMQIKVPSALADSWKAATNWSTYAEQIVGV